MPIRRALLSVYDKSGVVDLATALHARGVELLSTGGTYQALRDAGLPVIEVSAYTGFPEMMDGRVKTLHPKIHGGLLCVRDDPHHREAAAANGIGMIDLVVVNLYPFEATADKPQASTADKIEKIDIGGPSMLRSAAKNHAYVRCSAIRWTTRPSSPSSRRTPATPPWPSAAAVRGRCSAPPHATMR